MCKIFEEYGKEVAAEARAEAIAEKSIEIAESLLRDGGLPTERIAASTGLPLATV